MLYAVSQSWRQVVEQGANTVVVGVVLQETGQGSVVVRSIMQSGRAHAGGNG